MVSATGDRWSYYVSAEDYQSYLGNISNSYVGVGITITAKNDDDGNLIGYEVTNVSSGGSAEEAGVLAGDILTQVAAVESALQAFGYVILQEHMKTCVVEEIKKGNTAIVDEAVELVKKLK